MAIIIKNEIGKSLEKAGVKIIEYKRYVYNRCRFSGEDPQSVANRWITIVTFRLGQFTDHTSSSIQAAAFFPATVLHIIAMQTAANTEAANSVRECYLRSAKEARGWTVKSLKEYIDHVEKAAAEGMKETADALSDMKRSIPKIIKRYPLANRVAKCEWNDQCSRRPRYVARSTL